MAPFESEDFWDDLLAFVEQGRVIPVVGPELLTIKGDTGPVPLYRVVADRLLDRYGIRGLQQQTYGLFVTTTPDDLLSRALQSERGVVPEQIEYAPKLPTPRRRDIPETASSRCRPSFIEATVTSSN